MIRVRPHSAKAARQDVPDALERLYVYFFGGATIVLIVLILAVFYARGALERQREELLGAIEKLEARVAQLEGGVTEEGAADTQSASDDEAAAPVTDQRTIEDDNREPGETTPVAEPDEDELPDVEDTPRDEPGESTTGGGERAARAVPTQQVVDGMLDAALTRGEGVPFVVSDLVAAQSAIETGNANLDAAQWSGAAWERLGIVARLMGDSASADRFAQRAYRDGASLRDFSQVSARVLLNMGRPNDALVHADHFAEVTDGSPAARLLLARIFLAQERLGPADEIVSEIGPDAHLTPVEQLALARVWLALQRWDALAATMAAVKRVPETLEPERNFLQAVAQIQQERDLVVALSVLDYLAEDLGRAPAKVVGPDAAARPTVYGVLTWRGVARMRGEQMASARQAFAEAIQERPDLPDAYYWNAELEVREGQYDTAQTLLQNALATSANYAPAWETLGWMALETGNIELALEDLRNAVVANPRRASAHFLIAHASAQLANRDETAAALRAAFALDPSYVDKAKTEVFLRLFSEAELEALAADAATGEGEDDQAE